MCYALGALDTYDGIYDIESVEMTIFQPRRENISTFTISKEDLLAWAEGFLKPTAELAYNGEGEFHARDHCQFCKVKATCRKRAEYNMELAAYDFEQPATLDDAEIASILPRIDDLVAWAGDIKDYALQQAMSGTEYPGFKVVEGKSIRKYTDENAVASAVTDYQPRKSPVRLDGRTIRQLYGLRCQISRNHQYTEIQGCRCHYEPESTQNFYPETQNQYAHRSPIIYT